MEGHIVEVNVILRIIPRCRRRAPLQSRVVLSPDPRSAASTALYSLPQVCTKIRKQIRPLVFGFDPVHVQQHELSHIIDHLGTVQADSIRTLFIEVNSGKKQKVDLVVPAYKALSQLHRSGELTSVYIYVGRRKHPNGKAVQDELRRLLSGSDSARPVKVQAFWCPYVYLVVWRHSRLVEKS